MKIEGAMNKNVKSSIFQKNLAKTLGGYFGAKKVDFFNSKSKNGYSPMHSSSFWVKNQNLSRSFHVYQISALVSSPVQLWPHPMVFLNPSLIITWEQLVSINGFSHMTNKQEQ